MKTVLLLTLAAVAATLLIAVVGQRTPPVTRLVSRLKRRFIAQRLLMMVVVWRAALASARALGSANRWVFGYARAATLLLTLIPTTVFALRDQRDEALIAGGLWLFGLLIIAAFATARDRLIIGEFKSAGAVVTPPIDLANLLLVEISRLGDLFRVVGDRRTVSSGLTHQQGLDATLSVDDLVENLRGTVSSEAKATLGPVTIPLAPLARILQQAA